MRRLKIKLVVLGRLPSDFAIKDITSWKSSLFEINPHVDSYELNLDAEGADWEFMDRQFYSLLPPLDGADFLIVLLSVKLQHNWYLRRLNDNRIIFTFYELDQILRFSNIPLKNVVLRVIYAASLIYRRFGNKIPSASEPANYTHDETRGCLFDMNASKLDVVHSCHRPIICEQCIGALKKARVSNETISLTQLEIGKIQKPLFHKIVDFVKSHPLWSIAISMSTALVVGILASVIAGFIYDAIK